MHFQGLHQMVGQDKGKHCRGQKEGRQKKGEKQFWQAMIEDSEGGHLACGGHNKGHGPAVCTLSQRIHWDGRDDLAVHNSQVAPAA